jgi:hypothetical protein
MKKNNCHYGVLLCGFHEVLKFPLKTRFLSRCIQSQFRKLVRHLSEIIMRNNDKVLTTKILCRH